MSSLSLLEAAKQKRKNKNKKYDNNWSLEEFYLFCYAYKNPQSYGPAIERRYVENLCLTKIPASEERGDILENRLYKEVKGSISDNNTFNMVQIRPHHKVDSYVCPWANINEDGSVDTYLFDVPSEVVYSLNLGSAHGRNIDIHSKKEYRITIKKNSDNWKKILPFLVEGKKW